MSKKQKELKPSEKARMDEVIRIGTDRALPAAKTLKAAFLEDPFFCWLFEKSKDKDAGQKIWWEWILKNPAPFSEVYALGDISGVAVWLPSADLLLTLKREAGLTGEGGGNLENSSYSKDTEGKDFEDKDFEEMCSRLIGKRARIIQKIVEHYPDGEWWYLSAIGVQPEFFGQGRGSRLLNAKLKHLDKAGIPGYLEASSLKSTALYARHGFSEMEPLDFSSEFKGVPLLYPMWRKPK